MSNQSISKTLFPALFAAVMLLTASSLFAQVKIGTNPTTINPANNLEVESSTAGNKVSVDKTTGKVTIADGSQGAAKILTSDINGVATWQAPTSIKIPVTAFTGYKTGSSVLTTSTVGGAASTTIPLTTVNPASNWNAATNEYTIPSAGLYRIEYNSILGNVVPGKVYYNEWINLTAGTKQQTFPMAGGSGGWGISLFIVGAFTGGEKVRVFIYSFDIGANLIADQMTITDATLFVTKIE